ncbi:MAG: XdhC family protein [Alphaproteobacteria bacterium]|nr:MAG: XdhC family protein [Alphaproteobacteria bacterium]
MTEAPTALPDDDILEQALNWRKEGRDVALATVIKTWGSAPRPVGSQLAIDETGNMIGSVSGGCVEGAVIQEALEILKSGEIKTLEFGVSDDQAWEVGLACGGSINVFVEKLN